MQDIFETDIVIIGAGCSGMTLALYLASGGYTGSVVLIDHRTDFLREQRWCSWSPVTVPIPNAIEYSWSRFTISGPDCKLTRSTGNSSYIHVYAPEYFNAIRQELSKHPNFRLHLGEAIEAIEQGRDSGRWHIRTNNRELSAGIVFDGRNLESYFDCKQVSAPWLWQSFAGQTVTTTESVFDPETVTLMDFNVPGGECGSFVYVLPFSDKCALIESTLISTRMATEAEHLLMVDLYLDRLTKSVVVRGAIEFGNIPMTTSRMPMKRGENYYAIGISGGAAKPSTGYAFARIQNQCRQIADKLTRSAGCIQEAMSAATVRRQWLDDVFITAAADNNRFFTTTTLALAKKLSSDMLIRFLSERSSIADDATVMAAVGSRELIRAASKVAKPRR